MFDISSPNTYIPTIFLSMIAVFVSILYKDAKRNERKSTKDLPYYTEIATSMDYINRCIHENGRFQYRKNIDSAISYDNKIYNSLRHAGTLYSMYLYENIGYENKYFDQRILASEYFIENYIKPLDDEKSYIITLPKEENIKFPIAKSGACGVALCALANLLKTNNIKSKTLEALGEFILFMTDENGKVFAYYDLEKNEINKEAEALYYSGECACGLLYLYEHNPQEKWLITAKKIISNIIKTRKNLDFDIPFDHWIALAIEKLFLHEWVTPEEKKSFESFVEQMAIPMLSKQITNIKNSYCGAFNDNIMPCSVGTIMEGLAAIYFCTSSQDLKKILFKSLSIGCMFLSKVQVKTGEQAGGLPNSANWVKAGVTQNASVIRIDNVQHVVTAWLKFQKILAVTDNY